MTGSVPAQMPPGPEDDTRARGRGVQFWQLETWGQEHGEADLPTSTRSIEPSDVRDVVEGQLNADVPTESLGVEIEWLVSDPTERTRRPPLDEIQAVGGRLGPLPGGGRLTYEPGGQIELVTLPNTTVDELCESAATDLLMVERAFAASGLELVALGCDPERDPERVTTAQRYQAMEEHFDAGGDEGRRMMNNTASVHLNVGRGRTTELQTRWEVANAIGPVLVASFANSPFDERGPTGWVSTRQRAWMGIDNSRTSPVARDRPVEAAWADYALDASVMLIRNDTGRFTALQPGFSFRRWVAEGHELGWPTTDDLLYHMTTLFPPVRPRGWLEIRVLDSLPTPFWHAAVAMASALLATDVAEDVLDSVAGTEDMWAEAARVGLDHPDLAAAASRCSAIAGNYLSESRCDQGIQAVVDAYTSRWIERGRCPADDAVEHHRLTGDPWPAPASPVPFSELESSLP